MNALPGDWRRRRGTKTDAHLYASGAPRPMCGKVIERYQTAAARLATAPRSRSNYTIALPCTECLVQAITRRNGRGDPVPLVAGGTPPVAGSRGPQEGD